MYFIESQDKFDINKLFGFSSGWRHHKNSARIGWNTIGNKIYLHAYCYINGSRVTEFIKTIEPDVEYKMSICNKSDHYLFTIISPSYWITQVKIKKSKQFKIGYNLWPYFGGNLKAPQDMSIELIKN